MRAALIALALLCAATSAGCGGARKTTATTSTTRLARAPAPPTGLRIGVAGSLPVQPVTGARIVRGTSLATMPAYPLVLVSAATADIATVESIARLHPTSHYAYVGGSTKGHHRPNLVGVVLDEKEAARLGGVVAGLVAREEGGTDARVAWVGPQEEPLAAAFSGGAKNALPGITVLRAWSKSLPASCKEAALGAIARGAIAVMAKRGLCADAAVAGALQQNRVGLRISDFEFPAVPIGVIVNDAIAGVFRGAEDLVFDASSGAIGIRHLDPRLSPDLAAQARAAAQQLGSGLRPSG